jgi:hypothetical protein
MIFPLLYIFYDIYCAFTRPQNISLYIYGIAFLNGFYCVFSPLWTLLHSNTITLFGYLYLCSESIIILCILLLQLQVAYRIKKRV